MKHYYLKNLTPILLLYCSLSGCENKANKIDSSSNFNDSPSEIRSSSINNSDCPFEDGTHEASVDYYNPETGYSNSYTLDVEVEACQVIQIDFPKGGWLDSDHISPGDLDEDGNTSIEDHEGRTFDIHIED